MRRKREGWRKGGQGGRGSQSATWWRGTLMGGKRGRKIGVGRIEETRKSPIIIFTNHRLCFLNHIPYYLGKEAQLLS
jgi:hypothetical protein